MSAPYAVLSEELPLVQYSLIRYALIGVAGLLVYGVIGSMIIMNLDPVNALYYTVITVATVGYGDISPESPIQKLFAVTLVLGGVGLVAYAFTLTIAVVTMAVQETVTGAREKRRIKASKNHFILCGYGRVGSAVHEELKKRNLDVIIIEKDKDVVKKEIWEEPDVLAIPGDATDEKIMMEAGIKRGRGVIITTGDDVDNLFITLTARELNPNIWIVTRASKRENIRRLFRSGADKVISPETSGAEDIYFAAMEPTTIKITVLHQVDNIRRESEIILKHGCTLENIEYHLPEFKEPLARKIGVSEISELNHFLDSLERDQSRKKSLERIYESVSGIHSHYISGPDQESLDAVVAELDKEGFLIGVNLSEDQIKKEARKRGRLVEVLIKPEIKITEMHDVKDIRAEAEIILKHGCSIEDIEYYLPGFHEPLWRKVGLSESSEMERFLEHLKDDPAKTESLERLYTLSGGGIHSHRVSGPDSESLGLVENDLKDKKFLLGVNLTNDEIRKKIKEYGRVSEMLIRHNVERVDDKRIIIRFGGRVLDSKHYLPGVRQVVTRKLYIKNQEDLENCEKELKKPEALRSLRALYDISRQIHSHTISAPDIRVIKKIEEALRKEGILLGVDLPEEEIWEIVERSDE